MANPIAFTPKPLDPREGLRRRLEDAPLRHAEALLVAYDVVQAAHDEGILDLLHGAVKHKNVVFEQLAEAAKMPETVDAMRNAISLAKMLSSIDPEMLSCVAAAVAKSQAGAAEASPSLWSIGKRAFSREGRRAMALGVDVLVALGSRRANSASHK